MSLTKCAPVRAESLALYQVSKSAQLAWMKIVQNAAVFGRLPLERGQQRSEARGESRWRSRCTRRRGRHGRGICTLEDGPSTCRLRPTVDWFFLNVDLVSEDRLVSLRMIRSWPAESEVAPGVVLDESIDLDLSGDFDVGAAADEEVPVDQHLAGAGGAVVVRVDPGEVSDLQVIARVGVAVDLLAVTGGQPAVGGEKRVEEPPPDGYRVRLRSLLSWRRFVDRCEREPSPRIR